MCDFLSFIIQPSGEGLKILAAPDLRSHSDIEKLHNLTPNDLYYEAEWTSEEPESLQIRFTDDVPQAKHDLLRKFVLDQFPRQSSLIDYLLRTLDYSGASLNLSNTQITSLPDGFTVGGWLDLSNTPITSLPDGFTVGGWLNLSNTQITSLPDGLTVGGSLNLRNTPITSLPDGLTVGGSLSLRNTTITSLPDGLTVGGRIYKDF